MGFRSSWRLQVFGESVAVNPLRGAEYRREVAWWARPPVRWANRKRHRKRAAARLGRVRRYG
ncbi:hypothetical protein GS506_21755 [Rhodococcus hoagii]|nr:hypothetical protein [Prescottella equi]